MTERSVSQTFEATTNLKKSISISSCHPAYKQPNIKVCVHILLQNKHLIMRSKILQ